MIASYGWPDGDALNRKSASNKRNSFVRALLWPTSCCLYCGVDLTVETATIDHVMPRSKGGKDNLSNVVLACAGCNVKKSDKLLSSQSVCYEP